MQILALTCRDRVVDELPQQRVPNAVVADYFIASDVGIYPGDASPYFDAACPIKVLEYSAAGKPVVATNSGGPRDFVVDGVNGFLVEDDDELLRRLSELAADAAARARIGAAARLRAAEFSAASMAAAYERVYDTVRSS